MKILHAYNLHKFGGGSDNACLQTIALLRQNNVDVEVFTKDSKDIPDKLSGKVKAFYSGIYPPGTINEFREVLTKLKPDIVHAHELYPLISPWILPECKKRNIPVVMTCYDYRMTCPIATHYRCGNVCTACMDKGEHQAIINNCREKPLESIAYAARNIVARRNNLFLDYVDKYIVLNEFSREWMTEKLAIAPEKIAIIGCVIPPSNNPVNPAEGQYVAYAGRFPKEKGVDILVAAADLIKYPVKLAGYEDNLPKFASPWVEVIRTTSKQELTAFYRNAKMLVMPSVWFETFGIVAAEAMAEGVPVVASNIGALRYTVQDKVSGLLFEVGNSRDLSDKINELLKNPGLLTQLGHGAYQQVLNEYEERVIFDKLHATYSSLLNR